jgi:hypothetical protein
MAIQANDRTKRDRVVAILKNYDLDGSAVWDCHGTPVIFHWACERIATKAGIVFSSPEIIDRDTINKTVTLLVSGKVADRVEWSFGEVTKANCQNAYPWAMAEKRAKDRVTLKFAGLSGEVYSEEEADAFKQGSQADQPAARKSAAQAKRDGDNERIREMFNTAPSLADLESRWQHVRDNDLPTLPQSWADPIRDAYEAARENLQTLERSAA